MAPWNPLVSVVIPCHNASNYIRDTIASALNQTYANIEIIAIDDRSTDDTREILANIARLHSKVRVVYLEEGSGSPAKPRNVGVLQSSGDLIAFLDADDLWHPEKLAIQVGAILSSGLPMCSTSMIDFTSDSELSALPRDAPRHRKHSQITFFDQAIKYRTPTSSILIRRELMVRHPFPEAIELRGREDFACMLAVHEDIGASLKIHCPLMYYRRHPSQISFNKLEMAYKQMLVLRRYKSLDGHGLGGAAYFFVLCHAVMSIYYRIFRRVL